jgi:hypothetical protein
VAAEEVRALVSQVGPEVETTLLELQPEPVQLVKVFQVVRVPPAAQAVEVEWRGVVDLDLHLLLLSPCLGPDAHLQSEELLMEWEEVVLEELMVIAHLFIHFTAAEQTPQCHPFCLRRINMEPVVTG